MSKRWRGCLLEIVETILLTVVIFFVVQHFVAQPYQILQVSMEHTLEPGQYVLVDKLSPIFSDYKRGDVIVFQPPAGYSEDGQNIPFIKRVIGVAGDLVEIHDNSVYVNGVKLDEPYVYEGQPTVPLTGQSSWRVPAGDLFVLGDHRQEFAGLARLRADTEVDGDRAGVAALLADVRFRLGSVGAVPGRSERSVLLSRDRGSRVALARPFGVVGSRPHRSTSGARRPSSGTPGSGLSRPVRARRPRACARPAARPRRTTNAPASRSPFPRRGRGTAVPAAGDRLPSGA